MSAPAGEHQAVDQLEHLAGLVDQLLVRHQPQRQPAGALDRGDVADRDSSAAGWSQTLQRARSSAAQMPITGLFIPQTIGSRESGRLRAGLRARAPAGHSGFLREETMSETTTELQTVKLHVEDGAATVELNRPEVLNAWNGQLGDDLRAAFERIAADDAIRAVLITGAGAPSPREPTCKDVGGGFTTEDGRPDVYRTLTERYHPIMKAIREMPKPVVAAVNGPAVGIGCSLALCCDLILAAESAYFLLAFVNIGLVPDGGSSLFVPTRVGMARATELSMLGERLRAQKALEWGLINRVVVDELLLEEAGGLVGAHGRRPDALVRGHQAPAQQLAVPAHGRAARARGPDPARDVPEQGLPRGRDGLRREAPAALHRRLSRSRSICYQAGTAGLPIQSRAPWASCAPLLAFFTPESGGSPNANEIDSLYKVELVIALIIFFAVEGALVYALIRFRKRKGAVPAQIRGNTRLECGWTVGAARDPRGAGGAHLREAVLDREPTQLQRRRRYSASEDGQLLYASSQRKLPPNGKALNITVIGRQYIWQYIYPGATEPDGLGAPYSYEEMVVPTETTVSLDIVSADVVHAWWIPELGGKFQAVPGYHNYTWFKIAKPGVFHGQCAFLCGRAARAHARHRAGRAAGAVRSLARQPEDSCISQANQAAKVAREKLGAQTGAGQVENP